jgi:hypothetical protein
VTYVHELGNKQAYDNTTPTNNWATLFVRLRIKLISKFLVELSKVLEKNSNTTKIEIEWIYYRYRQPFASNELTASSKLMGQMKSTFIVRFSASHCHFSLYCLKSLEKERKKEVKTNRYFIIIVLFYIMNHNKFSHGS